MATADEVARAEQRNFYDARYRVGYMHGFDDFYEACRVRTIVAALAGLDVSPRRVLDFGCGEGRYLDVLRERFPDAAFTGADVSSVALEIASGARPYATYQPIVDDTISEHDGAFDLILSVEVLEHVADVRRSIGEISRLLAPGGLAMITTPCANRWSIEWVAMRLSGGLQRSKDGFGRFSTDEPGHLRRLTSGELSGLLKEQGIEVVSARFRGQLFAYPVASRYARKLLPERVRIAIGMLDWRLFRRLPTGSTMLVVGHKNHA
jgi:SAM-dependent methyltransferase